MELKTYQAYSMAEALAAVKRDLGRDAVILHTRSFRNGGLLGLGGRQMWEITASRNVNVRRRRVRPLSPAPRRAKAAAPSGVRVIEGPAYVAPPPAPAVTTDPVGAELTDQMRQLTTMVTKLVDQRGPEGTPPVPAELFELYVQLIQNEVAEDIAKELVEKVRAELTGDQLGDKTLIRQRLSEFIASMIPTSVADIEPGTGRPRVIALIGPTGVGKTTTIAKLAANLKLRRRLRVGLITIDTYRIAAVEQLRTYAQIIQVPLTVTMTPDELAGAIEDFADYDVVLIDTAGRSQNDCSRLTELEAFLAAAGADEVHLVLSTTAGRRNIESAVERFGRLGVDRLILTKLDEAVSFGMILSIVRRMDAALSFVTTGQDVPEDIAPSEGHRHKLAELIVGGTPT